MQEDPLDIARRLGLALAAETFPDAVRDAAAAAARMRSGFGRDLPPAAEPAVILPPPPERPGR
jgi:hypothetical protein